MADQFKSMTELMQLTIYDGINAANRGKYGLDY